ncbi:MAG: hypothetical protein AB1452_03285 [Pseudomonadota bacterium]
MRARLFELAARKAALRERASAERERFAALTAEVRRPLALAAGAVLLVALRPRRVLGWLASGWSALQLYRAVRLWWSRAAA